MRVLVMLLFLSALTVFVWSGVQYLMVRFARPLDRHRREHDQIQDRLEDLERRLEPPGGPGGRSR
jgi:hypothetical protein